MVVLWWILWSRTPTELKMSFFLGGWGLPYIYSTEPTKKNMNFGHFFDVMDFYKYNVPSRVPVFPIRSNLKSFDSPIPSMYLVYLPP